MVARSPVRSRNSSMNFTVLLVSTFCLKKTVDSFLRRMMKGTILRVLGRFLTRSPSGRHRKGILQTPFFYFHFTIISKMSKEIRKTFTNHLDNMRYHPYVKYWLRNCFDRLSLTRWIAFPSFVFRANPDPASPISFRHP